MRAFSSLFSQWSLFFRGSILSPRCAGTRRSARPRASTAGLSLWRCFSASLGAPTVCGRFAADWPLWRASSAIWVWVPLRRARRSPLANAARLRKRKQFKEWHGYSAPRNLDLHNRAQIAVPLLANRGLFALIPPASRGKLCPMASGGFTIALGADCPFRPEYVLGILNSKLMFWFLGCISNVFRGGWITCTKQYFGELPIPV